MQCVILAGGLGTRLGPLAADVPKHLVDVGGRPFADLQLAWLKAQGVTEVVYCVGHRGDAIRAFVGDGARWGLEVAYVDEGTQLQGTGGALRMAFDHGVLRPWAFVLYGDSYLDLPLSQLHATLAASELDAAMAVFRNDDRWDRSNVVFSPGVPLRYDKARPAELRPAMHHIDYGVSALSTHVLARVTPGVPADLADLMRDLSAEGRVAGFEAAARFYEVGTPEGLDELRRHLATREPAGARPR